MTRMYQRFGFRRVVGGVEVSLRLSGGGKTNQLRARTIVPLMPDGSFPRAGVVEWMNEQSVRTHPDAARTSLTSEGL